MWKTLPLIAFCAVLFLPPAGAETFRFAYTKGEKYRIVSKVAEAVFIDGVHSHDADILNKISVTVTDVKDGSGSHEVTYQTSERAIGSLDSYSWSEEYDSVFWRNARGAYTIADAYFMPVIRDVPLFPEENVPVGKSWSAPGSEVHDFRASFGVARAFHFPINVTYTYLRDEKRGGARCAVISITYTVFHKVPDVPRGQRNFPVRITGSSDELLWWDLDNRRPIYYEEKFDFYYTLASGVEVEYQGTASAEVLDAKPLDKPKIAEDIAKDVAAIPNATVRQEAEGVTISLEKIRFPPNSFELLPAEKDKLRQIAEILLKYPDRDIMVSGHTAKVAGYTEQDNQDLSEKRAKAAGDYLLSLGVRKPEQLATKGMGSRAPIGDNATDEGQQKNRRVEFTILEN